MILRSLTQISDKIEVEAVLIEGWNGILFEEAKRVITLHDGLKNVLFEIVEALSFAIMPSNDMKKFVVVADLNQFDNRKRIMCSLEFSEFFPDDKKRGKILEVSEFLHDCHIMATEMIITKSK